MCCWHPKVRRKGGPSYYPDPCPAPVVGEGKWGVGVADGPRRRCDRDPRSLDHDGPDRRDGQRVTSDERSDTCDYGPRGVGGEGEVGWALVVGGRRGTFVVGYLFYGDPGRGWVGKRGLRDV